MNVCPLCGGTVAYLGLNSLECHTVGCGNYVKPKYDWRTHLQDIILEKLSVEVGEPNLHFLISKTSKKT